MPQGLSPHSRAPPAAAAPGPSPRSRCYSSTPWRGSGRALRPRRGWTASVTSPSGHISSQILRDKSRRAIFRVWVAETMGNYCLWVQSFSLECWKPSENGLCCWLCNNINDLIPLNCTPKNGLDGRFYVHFTTIKIIFKYQKACNSKSKGPVTWISIYEMLWRKNTLLRKERDNIYKVWSEREILALDTVSLKWLLNSAPIH